MPNFVTLAEAIRDYVRDRDSVALEGFTHLIPFAAGHEIIRQEKRDLTLIRMTPDLIYDQLIGMANVSNLVFSWGGNPGVGSLHRLRDAIENDWPSSLQIDERSHADMANAYVAGATNLPFALLRGHSRHELPKHNQNLSEITCPFTGEKLAAVRALNPDVAIIHAQQSDRQGNIMAWGITGVQKEAVMSARRAIVTVEEIVDHFEPKPNSLFLASKTISAVCCVPGGAKPSYALGYYRRDNTFYATWDEISRDRSKFVDWMNQHVIGTQDFEAYEKSYTAAMIEHQPWI